MLTKNNTKFIKSLQLKKFRQKEGLFIVEGGKNTLELLNSSYKIKMLVATQYFIDRYSDKIEYLSIEPFVLKEEELASISTFKTNNSALAVVHEKKANEYHTSGFELVLDDIRDPGNLGAIIRIADWYGIKNIICSPTTADFFNPKVISASMGSIFRMNLFREDLSTFLAKQEGRAVYAAVLAGENVHKMDFKKEGLLIIGNESHGIQSELLSKVTTKVTIPKIGQAESLNAAMATAILCDNVFRAH